MDLQFLSPLHFNSHYGALLAAVDGGTVTFDLSLSDLHILTLGGNRTLALTGDQVGQSFEILLKQPGAGGPYTPTWWSGITWSGGSAPATAVAADAVDSFAVLKTGSGTYLR